MQADDVGVGCIEELNELIFLLFSCGFPGIVCDDGDGAVGVRIAAEVDGAVVEDVAAYDERSCDGHPGEPGLEEEPEDDEEEVDGEEDGEGECQQREAREDVGRDECQGDAEPHQHDGAEVGAEEEAD